jgi:hypothetical protein
MTKWVKSYRPIEPIAPPDVGCCSKIGHGFASLRNVAKGHQPTFAVGVLIAAEVKKVTVVAVAANLRMALVRLAEKQRRALGDRGSKKLFDFSTQPGGRIFDLVRRDQHGLRRSALAFFDPAHF